MTTCPLWTKTLSVTYSVPLWATYINLGSFRISKTQILALSVLARKKWKMTKMRKKWKIQTYNFNFTTDF
jgi:hypothetical protein